MGQVLHGSATTTEAVGVLRLHEREEGDGRGLEHLHGQIRRKTRLRLIGRSSKM